MPRLAADQRRARRIGWSDVGLELQREIDESLLRPIDNPQIASGTNHPDFIADPVCDQRCFRIVQHDALLAVQPAWPLVYLGDDGIESKWQDSVIEHALLRIEDFPLPSKVVDQLGNFRRVLRTRSDDGGSLGLAAGDVAHGAFGEELIKLSL